MKKRVSFITLGCKVNQYETNAMMQKFQENGYEIVETLRLNGFYNMTESTVYPILQRLSKKGLIFSSKEKSKVGPKRKYYYITAKGEEYLLRLEETDFYEALNINEEDYAFGLRRTGQRIYHRRKASRTVRHRLRQV